MRRGLGTRLNVPTAWLAFPVAVAVTALAGCSESESLTSAQIVDWAGFTERAGVEIVSAQDVGRLDSTATFRLEGAPADVARAVEEAGFETPFAPGAEQVQAGLFASQLTDLTDMRSAQDAWRSPEGQTIYRQLLLGREGDSAVLLALATTVG